MFLCSFSFNTNSTSTQVLYARSSPVNGKWVFMHSTHAPQFFDIYIYIIPTILQTHNISTYFDGRSICHSLYVCICIYGAEGALSVSFTVHIAYVAENVKNEENFYHTLLRSRQNGWLAAIHRLTIESFSCQIRKPMLYVPHLLDTNEPSLYSSG